MSDVSGDNRDEVNEPDAAASAQISENLRGAVAYATERMSAFGFDPCSGRLLSALADERVQAHFVKHIFANEAFSRAYCLGSYILEEDRLIFEFNCLPPKICLLPFRFLVRFNIIADKVVEVIDPAPALVPVSEQLPGAMFRL